MPTPARRRCARHTTQYFEMFCNRGIYHKGWTAVTKHRTPWTTEAPRHSTMTSGSSTHPTTGPRRTTWPTEPEKLPQLQRLWLIEAVRYNVVPLDDRTSSVSTPMSRVGRS